MPRMCTAVTVLDPLVGAVRVMTTHLEYYSRVQRMAQAWALRELHAEACARVLAQPMEDNSRSPFQHKTHTPHAILCGDFNLGPAEPEYLVLQRPFPVEDAPSSTPAAYQRLQDAWPLAHGRVPHAPTFRLFDRQYGPDGYKVQLFTAARHAHLAPTQGPRPDRPDR